MAVLDVGGKGLRELPDDLRDCEHLESLHCQGNLLQSLPKSLFFNCQNLTWLDLRNNRLTSLPSLIYKLRKLKTLLLAGNQLETLPAQLGLLPHLTGLSVAGNPLQDPPRHIVNQGTKMILIYLQDKMRNIARHKSVTDPMEFKQFDYLYCDSSSEDSSDEFDQPIPHPATRKIDSPMLSEMHMFQPALHISGPALHQPIMQHSVRTHQFGKFMHRQTATVPSAIPKVNTKQSNRKKVEEKSQLQDIKARARNGSLPPMPIALPSVDRYQNNDDIRKTLEKMKADQGLEDWRKRAKEMQREKQQEDVAGVPRTLSQVFPANERDTAAPSGKDSGQDEARQRLRQQHYKRRLEERRKQAGIISIPTAELHQAEERLAEAMGLHEEVQHKNREYRLRAFTGDLL